jgi:tyrosyl-tRNA synthetase
MEAKKTLGKDIVRFYHGDAAAEAACDAWVSRFSIGEDPKDIPEVSVPATDVTDGKAGIVKLISLLGLAKSNNDARRVIEGGGVNIGPGRERITDPKATVAVPDGLVVRYGKKKIVRVRLR